MFSDATPQQVDAALTAAWQAFQQVRSTLPEQRFRFMYAIAAELEKRATALIERAMAETNLPAPRLRSELSRTIFQLTSYADACTQGNWLEARIDTAEPDRNPPKPDIRKMMMPLGPVVVFGASNFPFAYSTAGGDTACAFAAGCPVIVKAHPAHAQTSQLVANAIADAASQCNMPAGIFAHVHGASTETGKALVMHPYTKAVGFTGSFAGGKALFDWANQRKEPIPVFAEMGSINPVFLLPEKLHLAAAEVARQYAASITLSVGQFCTNPGLIIGIDGPDLQQFLQELGQQVKSVVPGTMLHPGIGRAYAEKRAGALAEANVLTVAVSEQPPGENQGQPTIASATGQAFLNNPVLHQEVFGPYSLVVRCKNMEEMTTIAQTIEGQLTVSLMATEKDIVEHALLVNHVQQIGGRLIMNGVPTGVEVCLSMQHGGPFPATTDARFTSVGADGIKRFVRPLAFQNWPDALLPAALKNANPLNIWRTVNNQFTQQPL